MAETLRWEPRRSRRFVSAAERVAPQFALDGTELPPTLETTSAVFAAGEISMRHVEVISTLLATKAAERIGPDKWEGAEAELAAHAPDSPPELQAWGTQLIERLDEDGPEPDDQPEPQINGVPPDPPPGPSRRQDHRPVRRRRDVRGRRHRRRCEILARRRGDQRSGAGTSGRGPRRGLRPRAGTRTGTDAAGDGRSTPAGRRDRRTRGSRGTCAVGDARTRRRDHSVRTADAGVRCRRRAGRARWQRRTPRRRPDQTHNPRRSSSRGHRPGPGMRRPGVRPTYRLVRDPPCDPSIRWRHRDREPHDAVSRPPPPEVHQSGGRTDRRRAPGVRTAGRVDPYRRPGRRPEHSRRPVRLARTSPPSSCRSRVWSSARRPCASQTSPTSTYSPEVGRQRPLPFVAGVDTRRNSGRSVAGRYEYKVVELREGLMGGKMSGSKMEEGPQRPRR